MPHAVAAGIASTALAPAVVGGGLTTALGTGLALGSGLAASGGITGLMGGLGGAGAVAPGAFGALAPAAMAKLAPAAASQLAGTIGAGVAPGAFGANLAGAAAPGLTGSAAQNLGLNALKSQVIGTGVQNAAAQQATNLAFQNAAAQNMAGGLANPISQMGAKYLANSPYPIADPNNPLLRASLANYQTPHLAQNAVVSDVPNAVTSPELLTKTVPSPYDLTTASNAARYKSGLSPAANTVSETGQLIADPRSELLGRGIRPNQNFMQNLSNIGSFQDVKDYAEQHPYATAGIAGLGAMGVKKLFDQEGVQQPESNAMIRPYTYDRSQRPEAYAVSPTQDSSERLYFNDQFIAGEPYKAAEGGLMGYAVGGPVEQMAAMNSVGANTGYPMANLQTPMYANPSMQRPEATNVIAPSADAGVSSYTGEARFSNGGPAFMGPIGSGYVGAGNYIENARIGGRSSTPAAPLPKYSYDPVTLQFTQTVGGNKVSGGIATPTTAPTTSMQPQRPATSINIPAYQTPEQQLGLGGFYDMMNQQLGGYAGYAAGGNVGGISHLGDYSDGGRLLKGPGDGVSDSIPASIGDRQPARLADGEFVVPARIVSELGNGSTEAGARKLYAMMDRIQKGRRKSVGKGKVAVNSKADKYLPA